MLCCPRHVNKCVRAPRILLKDVGKHPAFVAIRTNASGCLEKIWPQFASEILSVHGYEDLRLVAIRRDPSDQFCGVLQLLRVERHLRKEQLQINTFRSIAVNQSNFSNYGFWAALPGGLRGNGAPPTTPLSQHLP